MSILSDQKILKAIEKKEIVIEPFDINCLGSNSYDVHLSPYLMIYFRAFGGILDCKKENKSNNVTTIPDEGMVLQPDQLYLGSTVEYTETHKHVPYLDGKSSIGRLGISVHVTAGRGDVGFCNHWTLEITVVHPIRVYAGMPIGQLTFHTVSGKISSNYNEKGSAKYNERSPHPQASKMFKNFK